MGAIKKLTKIGNSFGIILSSDIMSLANIQPESEVEIEIENGKLIIHPVLQEDQKVKAAFAKFVSNYSDVLQKLAK